VDGEEAARPVPGPGPGPQAAPPGAAAAFFDLDRTLIAGSSAFQFARAARQAGLLSRRRLAADAWANVVFRLQGSTDEGTEAIKERISTTIAGAEVRVLMRLSPFVLANVLPRVYPEMLEIAYGHQDAGRRAYIVTAASAEMAESMAHVLQLDGGLGYRTEIREGVYTGRPAGPFTYREGKAQEMRRLAAEEGVDLSASFAYSDSESDLPMLRAVGHPVVVNPDRTLARVARAEGWPVIRLDRLGRWLKLAAAGAVALAGAGGVRVAPKVAARR
jgi:HAD superfamily hydrolase (TIGR01490 family)